MKHVFEIPDPITVPDGTELSELIGPRLLSEIGLRCNDGVSVAIGTLPAPITSKVHVHPVVWHFTWVRSGTLTVKMKDSSTEEPYELTVPTDHGVMTEAGTFFQLINKHDTPCEVYYIVGPAFVFELNDAGAVRYNDAVVFSHSWGELAAMDWKPPELPAHWKMHQDRMNSLYRTAAPEELTTVNFHRWTLSNGPGAVAVPSNLHKALLAASDHAELEAPLAPKDRQTPTADIEVMIESLVEFLGSDLKLALNHDDFLQQAKRITSHKCNGTPSLFEEYSLASSVYEVTHCHVQPEELWHLLFFGTHEEFEHSAHVTKLHAIRHHVINDILIYAATIGGGFRAAGTMENYRGYLGGTYTDPSSYRHYKL